MFQVLHGSDDTKNILVDILHSQGGNETGLKEFLKDIEEIENGNGNWWIAVDENKVPRGALTVRYINELSYLRYIWTMIYKNEDQSILYNALLNAWIENSRQGTKQYQIDLQIYSPLIKCVMDAGFRRQKLLLTSYEIKSDWYNTELPLGYVMRPVRREELDLIYQKLIAPDLDTSSPIYVSPEGFKEFTNRISDDVLTSWVVVEDDEEKIVGFGASYVDIRISSGSTMNNPIAVLYGPHSRETIVLKNIIAEMLSYWKSQNVETLRILRISEFVPSLIHYFNMKLVHSTIRYIGNF